MPQDLLAPEEQRESSFPETAQAPLRTHCRYAGRLPCAVRQGERPTVCTDVAAIGQHCHVLGTRPQDCQDQFALDGQIVLAPGKHVGDPPRHAVRAHERLDVPAEVARLSAILRVDLPALLRGLRPATPRILDILDQVRDLLGRRLPQRLPGIRGLIRKNPDRLVTVPVRGGARKAKPGPEPSDVTITKEPGQDEPGLVERGEHPRSPALPS